MNDSVLSIRDLRKSFGPIEIMRGVDLDLRPTERHALIGPNGAGKSTLFHLISGNLTPTSGEIIFDGRQVGGESPETLNRLGLARSFQITNIFPKLSVYENIRLAVMRPYRLQYSFWKSVNRLARVREETEKLLEQVRLNSQASTIAGEMAYSEQRSLEIAITLASNPKVILLDEPMAGMSHEEALYTAELIREVTSGRALMIVEHDMDVVFSLSDRISVLVYGQLIATGTPDEIRNNKSVKEAYLGEEVAQ
ncbi:ABC transporter ATP-binding protein [Noviherbaspirillum sedimenti]|uniref:ABC transporter ATP-binding protein n=1 Tax=Noviherbaspirillum sedimenti TaxID=2320865 RepID=A0A3A3G5X6_9BURK|nr:ABC transporter ATP-binding protein [Noviherbaspirillum sedimenti]RJG03927.1 ABC transporter ATP-binding protein [Noviherbaspirillum sedimenti]